LSLFIAGCGGSGSSPADKAAREKITQKTMEDAQKVMQQKMGQMKK
jgi:hypothetical protein